ncbi:MAG: 2-dehydro-3-deoxygluconokinase [Methanosphaera sp. rholeuAM6]|nr:MAG: 2-dehydro-3-deoxygluconokinase [Methanosphaera sp. rholeuAM6]
MKVITFGEIMLRLSPEGYKRFIQSDKFNVTYGGSEANVAISLSNYGIPVEFVTKVPNNEIGQSAINILRSYNVGTRHIIKEGERLGIYYLEKGASQRPSKVIYDRKNSAISKSNINEFDWDEIFNGANCFHISGITPALSKNLANISIAACKKAKEQGLLVSCDLNYRNKLWARKEANRVMSEIMKYVDVCVANEEDIEKVFNIKAENTDVEKGKLNIESYESVAKQIYEKFDCQIVACTLRTSLSANDNKWMSLAYDGEKTLQSKEYNIHIVDRVGAGDSFSAGLIYGLLNKMSLEETLEFATAASCLKHSIEGDFNIVTVDEVNNLVEGNASGRVQR